MSKQNDYIHQRWEPMRNFLQFLIRQVGFRLIARFDAVEGLENVPEKGAAILLYNHIAFIDPVAVLSTLNRNVVPIAKIEALSIPFFGVFTKLWGVIPIRRGEVDREALVSSFRVLEAGEMLLVAPEGTRSPALIEAKPGVAYLAARSGAPIVPVAVDGTEGFPSISPVRWSQPGVRIKFGRPFRFLTERGKASRDLLRQMTQEAMYKLAEILPESRRGYYQDLSRATTRTIEMLPAGS